MCLARQPPIPDAASGPQEPWEGNSLKKTTVELPLKERARPCGNETNLPSPHTQ
jgi:hypothetical protein